MEETDQEKDLGVIVENNLKPTTHCKKAANRGMTALRKLKGSFRALLSIRNSKPICNAFVRPHTEYCIQAVGPYMAQNFKTLERVQRRATKMVQGLSGSGRKVKRQKVNGCLVNGYYVESKEFIKSTSKKSKRQKVNGE